MSEPGLFASRPRPAVGSGEENPGGGNHRNSGKIGRGTRTEADELCRAYSENGRGLYAMAYRALGDRGLAEDIVQETFARAWRSRALYDEARSSRKNWLFTIARNLILDSVRGRSRSPGRFFSDGGESETTKTEDTSERSLIQLQVREALGRVSENHRRVIFEVHYRGRDYADVARELGVPSGTLRSRMYYALKSLRLALEETQYLHRP